MNEEKEKAIKFYEDKLEETIDEFVQFRNIDDLSKESQNIWNACMMFCRKRLFNADQLKGNAVNKNYYDIEKVNYICDLYIYYCMTYDKEISINGFSYLTGIATEVIQSWSNRDIIQVDNTNIDNSNIYNTYKDGSRVKPSAPHYSIYKKLVEGRESTLSAMLASGKRNPVGIIAILNHFYAWASPYTSDANRNAKSLAQRETVQQITTAERPQLPQND